MIYDNLSVYFNTVIIDDDAEMVFLAQNVIYIYTWF